MYKKIDNLRLFLTFFALFCLFLALAGPAFCTPDFQQEQGLLTDIDLNQSQYTWLSVKSGKSLCRPARTSYGWIDLTDGKMASAIAESGKIIWQKGLPYSPLPLLSVAAGDFSYVVLRNKKVCLLNHSGLVLWQAEIGFEPILPVLPARDGRAFVFGKDQAACLGINGIVKWRQKTEPLSQALAPVQANDGSLLLFLEALSDGKSAALRYSPFGELLERIVFAGKVVGAASVGQGALIAFDDGSLGLCAVGAGGEAQSVWLIKGAAYGQKVLFDQMPSRGTVAAASQGAAGTKVSVVDAKKAEAPLTFEIPEIKSLEYFAATKDGFFAASADFAVLYDLDGKKVRGARLLSKAKNGWDYVLFGNSGTIIFTSKNWNATGYKILDVAPAPKKKPEPTKDYKAFYQGQSEDFNRIKAAAGLARKQSLQAGGYGSKEKYYLFDSDWIVGDWMKKALSKNSVGGAVSLDQDNLFSFSLSEHTAAIGMLGLFGGAEQSKSLAKILALASDESVLLPALKAVQDCGYDPTGALLDSIERLTRAAQPGQETLLKELCGALYSVCRFMGRPAINAKGMSLLKTLQMPQYPRATKEEARKIYEKLAQLKI
ncbi:MAG: hypothetical protein IK015_02025 [Treponema sp.]|nr:hypothetical protein [Treponema sp.]